MPLNTAPNFANGDDFYEVLINTHRGLTEEQSRDVNCRLILLLANHIGDRETLQQALDLARKDIVPKG